MTTGPKVAAGYQAKIRDGGGVTKLVTPAHFGTAGIGGDGAVGVRNDVCVDVHDLGIGLSGESLSFFFVPRWAVFAGKHGRLGHRLESVERGRTPTAPTPLGRYAHRHNCGDILAHSDTSDPTSDVKRNAELVGNDEQVSGAGGGLRWHTQHIAQGEVFCSFIVGLIEPK